MRLRVPTRRSLSKRCPCSRSSEILLGLLAKRCKARFPEYVSHPTPTPTMRPHLPPPVGSARRLEDLAPTNPHLHLHPPRLPTSPATSIHRLHPPRPPTTSRDNATCGRVCCVGGEPVTGGVVLGSRVGGSGGVAPRRELRWWGSGGWQRRCVVVVGVKGRPSVR